MREDITRVLEAIAPNIRDELTSSCSASLELLNAHLSQDESVRCLSSAAAKKDGPVNSLLAITERRLIFVAPAPQVVGWKLSTLTKTQAFGGYFFVNGDAGDYSIGLTGGAWADWFEAQVKQASAVAVLAGH